MSQLMRCDYCGLLQDEPAGVKACSRCGGELHFEVPPPAEKSSYLEVSMELDQVAAPAGQNVERYLLVSLKTPGEVPPGERVPSDHQRLPVNLAAVLDNSGSMQGEKISHARQAVQQAVQFLKPGDAFSLVTFNSTVACVFEPRLMTGQNRQEVIDNLREVLASGTTALDGGLKMGIQKALVHKLDTNLVMLLSDGQTNVGEKDLEVIGARAQAARKKGLLVSALGIGMDYNEALLAEIATQGGGRFYHVETASQIPGFVAGELGEAAGMAAREVHISLNIPVGATLVPLSAAYPVAQNGGEAVVTVGDMPCETELEIPLRLALVGGTPGQKLAITGIVTFLSPAGSHLEQDLNKVTVRFKAKAEFAMTEGVVIPVVERVLSKMSAASMLGVSRTRARTPNKADEYSRVSLESLRQYASLLGKERADKEVMAIQEDLNMLYASPAAAKQAVSFAYRSIRGSKDFTNKP
jgi:Mg-chelatase subunit ChlD